MLPSICTLGAEQLKLRYKSQFWLALRVKVTSPKTVFGSDGNGSVPKSQTNVPFAPNTIPIHGSNAIPAAVAPTGGGGGAGISSVGTTHAGGTGGSILESNSFNATVISGLTLLNNNTNVTPPSMSFYGTLVGLGGRGGRTAATAYKPANGAKYGGGGGGGVAHPTGTYNEHLGGFGGPGVVVVISEA